MEIRVIDRTGDRVQRSSNLSANDVQKAAADAVRIDGLVSLEIDPDEACLFTEENRMAGLNYVLTEQDWPILGRPDLKMKYLFLELKLAENELRAALA